MSLMVKACPLVQISIEVKFGSSHSQASVSPIHSFIILPAYRIYSVIPAAGLLFQPH